MIELQTSSRLWSARLIKKYEVVLSTPQQHRRKSCAFVFAITFTLKILQFNGTIFRFQQDESDYYLDLLHNSFASYILVPDAGYPIPGLRLLTWVLYSVLPSPGIFHIAVTLISSLCVVLPLAMCDSENDYSYIFFSMLTLGTFWSSDLLLGHNLPYYFALPVLMKIHKDPSLGETSTKIILFLAAIFASKPQILLIFLFVTVYSFISLQQSRRKLRKNQLITGILCLTFCLILVLGRSGPSSMDLNLDPKDLGTRLVLVPFAFTSHLAPLITFSLAGLNYFNLLPNQIWLIVSLSAFLAMSAVFFWLLRFSRTKIFVCGFVIGLIVPLLVFPNSGWSVYTPSSFLYFPLIHQRHDFFVLAALLLVVIPTLASRDSRFKFAKIMNLFLICLLMQEAVFIIVYQYFPSPR